MSDGRPSERIVVRAMTPADVARITAIRMAVKENVLSDPSKVTAEEVEWYVAKGHSYVSEADGLVQGFAMANPQTGYVWALFVDPSREGRGHGRTLCEHICRKLAEAGHRQAFLTTGEGTRAERFYAAGGWRVTGSSLSGELVFVRPLDV